MRNRLTAYILTGMVLGVIVGFVANLWVGGDEALAKDVAGYFHLLADIFLHLIKMIIAPLVFSTLVAGIAHMGDSAALVVDPNDKRREGFCSTDHRLHTNTDEQNRVLKEGARLAWRK